jgi:hypothetical protein
VGEGSPYPALQRLLLQGWVPAEWKKTDTNRRARFYTSTQAGLPRASSLRTAPPAWTPERPCAPSNFLRSRVSHRLFRGTPCLARFNLPSPCASSTVSLRLFDHANFFQRVHILYNQLIRHRPILRGHFFPDAHSRMCDIHEIERLVRIVLTTAP